MSEPPYRESGQVVTNIETHYHFENMTRAVAISLWILAAGNVVNTIVAWRIKVAKIQAESPAPPAPCTDQTYDMRDYSVATCDQGAALVHEPGSEFIFCRCPRSTTSP